LERVVTVYNYPQLPRANNDLELFFRRTKQRHRRITGSRTWNRHIIRHGENIVFIENVPNKKEALNMIKTTDYSSYLKVAACWEKRISEHIKQRHFKKDPNAYLNNIEDR
jgi:hypothetical protein